METDRSNSNGAIGEEVEEEGGNAAGDNTLHLSRSSRSARGGEELELAIGGGALLTREEAAAPEPTGAIQNNP